MPVDPHDVDSDITVQVGSETIDIAAHEVPLIAHLIEPHDEGHWYRYQLRQGVLIEDVLRAIDDPAPELPKEPMQDPALEPGSPRSSVRQRDAETAAWNQGRELGL